MSNLALTNNPGNDSRPVAEKLSREENSIVSVAAPSERNPRICEMTSQQIGDIITAIVLKKTIRLGHKALDAEEQKIINAELNRDLVLKLSNFTEREIMMALENGCDGLYLRKPDDPIIFTPSNFVQWCRAFVEQTKKPVMKKALQLIQQQKDEEWTAPESEKLKMSHEFFLSILKRVLDGEAFEDWGNRVYDFLDKIGFMLVTPADKWKAIDRAKLKLIAEAREIKDAVAQRTAIQKAMEMIGREEAHPEEAIKSAAKRILVGDKLRAYKEMPEDEQTMLLESISERVEYMCIELKEPEQYNPSDQ